MQTARPRFVRRTVAPREHGAWAVLYGAFVAGVGVAGRVTVPVILLFAVVTLLAFANGPLTELVRPARVPRARDQRRHAVVWLTVCGVGALAAAVPLLTRYRMTFLLPFGAAAACAVALRAWLVREGDDRSLAGELLGTVGLTLVGPAAHAGAVGGVEPVGAVLWVLLVLFFASGVFYVRMRIRLLMVHRKGATATANPARWWCALYHCFLLLVVPALAAGGLIPWAALVAFAPALWRAAAGLRRREASLDLRRLGWSEVGLTAVFVLLLIVAL